MNGPQLTACLANGYIIKKLARCPLFTDSGSKDVLKLQQGSYGTGSQDAWKNL